MGKTKIKRKVKGDLTQLVRRNELLEIFKQMKDNVELTAKYLMDDMNTLFRKHVYPNTVNINALVELLTEKGIITEEELEKKHKEIVKRAVDKAKKEKAEKEEKGKDEKEEK